MWSSSRVKKFLDDFAARNSLVIEWSAAILTGGQLVKSNICELAKLFKQCDQKAGLNLFYTLHPTEVILISLFRGSCMVDDRNCHT